MAGDEGIEPPTRAPACKEKIAVTVFSKTTSITRDTISPIPYMAGPPRFELRTSESKSLVFPLHHGPIKAIGWSRTSTSSHRPRRTRTSKAITLLCHFSLLSHM